LTFSLYLRDFITSHRVNLMRASLSIPPLSLSLAINEPSFVKRLGSG
jgi:hypothetical protein